MSDILTRLKSFGVKKLCIMAIPYLVIFYAGNRMHWLYCYCRAPDELSRIGVWLSNMRLAFRTPLISLNPSDLLAGFIAAAGFVFFMEYRKANGKKFRVGQEYGSAKWGTESDIRPFKDPNPRNNILLTWTEQITLSGRPKNPKYARNKNVLVIGENVIIGLSHLTFRKRKAT